MAISTIPGMDLATLINYLRGNMGQATVPAGSSDPLSQAYLQSQTQQMIAALNAAANLTNQNQGNMVQWAQLMGTDPSGTMTDPAQQWRQQLAAQQAVQNQSLANQLTQIMGTNAGGQQTQGVQQQWAQIMGANAGGTPTLGGQQAAAQLAQIMGRDASGNATLGGQQLAQQGSQFGQQLAEQQAEFARNAALQQAGLMGMDASGNLTEAGRAARAQEAQARAQIGAQLTGTPKDYYKAANYFSGLRQADRGNLPQTLQASDLYSAVGAPGGSLSGQYGTGGTGGTGHTADREQGGTSGASVDLPSFGSTPSQSEREKTEQGMGPSGPVVPVVGPRPGAPPRGVKVTTVTAAPAETPDDIEALLRQFSKLGLSAAASGEVKKGARSRPRRAGLGPGGEGGDDDNPSNVSGEQPNTATSSSDNASSSGGSDPGLSITGFSMAPADPTPQQPLPTAQQPSPSATDPVPTAPTGPTTGLETGATGAAPSGGASSPYMPSGASTDAQTGDWGDLFGSAAQGHLNDMANWLTSVGVQGAGPQWLQSRDPTQQALDLAAIQALGLSPDDYAYYLKNYGFANTGGALSA